MPLVFQFETLWMAKERKQDVENKAKERMEEGEKECERKITECATLGKHHNFLFVHCILGYFPGSTSFPTIHLIRIDSTENTPQINKTMVCHFNVYRFRYCLHSTFSFLPFARTLPIEKILIIWLMCLCTLGFFFGSAMHTIKC